jgi:hypothetical protein
LSEITEAVLLTVSAGEGTLTCGDWGLRLNKNKINANNPMRVPITAILTLLVEIEFDLTVLLASLKATGISSIDVTFLDLMLIILALCGGSIIIIIISFSVSSAKFQVN